MDNIVVPAISVIIGVAALFLGIVMGSMLGKEGSLHILSAVTRLPASLISSRRKLISRWKMWRELMDSRKIERLKIKKKVEELEEQISHHKQGIKNIKAGIRRVKWELSEPGQK